MKQIHLLCNAHLDPVWQWCRPEGLGEAISTFRVAADFCEKYDGFVFNHNESLLYEWVEEYDPALFSRIQKLVAEGKWKIMGGWYLQPDCTMPCGESFIRQIEVGNKFFKEKFNVIPKTAVNVDPFGHSRGLVQILTKTGYDSYLFMRPNGFVPENDFIWEGFDGSQIIGHCLWAAYRTPKGQALNRLHAAMGLPKEKNLVLWGIGNHGGGPSKEDLESIETFIEQHPELEIVHSDCERYFDTVSTDGSRKIDRSLVHIMVGCYTSMVRIKQLNRKLENKLSVCEKLLSVSGISFDKKEFQNAEKALLFNQFHDILPGSMVKDAENEAIQLYNYGNEIVSRLITKALFRLCENQAKARDGEIPVMVFNPHPYPVETDITVEFMLQEQNRNDNQVTVARARDTDNNILPTQNLKEESNINMDWRKKVSFHTVLKPIQINRFDLELHIEPLAKRPVAPYTETDQHIIVANDRLRVEINKQTGLIDRYCVNGIDYVKPNSASIRVYRSDEDPWGMEINGYRDCIGTMELLSDKQENRFNGCGEDESFPNVRVIENGEVLCRIQATFGYENSFSTLTYTIPKHGDRVDIHCKMISNDANRVYKLCFEVPFENAEFIGQTAFGSESLIGNEFEVVYQKWCGLQKEDKGLYVMNRGTYGGSLRDNNLQITLLHTSAYCAHPIPNRKLVDYSQHLDRIDIGVREFDFALTTNQGQIDSLSEQFNQPPETLVYFPDGNGNIPNISVELSNQQIILSRMMPLDNGDMLIRLFNPLNRDTETDLFIDKKSFNVKLSRYEIATYQFDGENLTERAIIDL